MGNKTAQGGESSASGALAATRFSPADDPLRTGELSESLTGLCEKHGATYEYQRDQKTGEAVLRLHLPNGDVIAGRGANGDTALALTNLRQRVGALVAE